MNPALALDRLHEDLGDTCICGPRPGFHQPCSGKWRSAKRRNSPYSSSSSAASGGRDGLKEDIADLRDRFVLLREEKRRLTATRVANLAMCNDCLRADRVPEVVDDLLKGFKVLAMRREAQYDDEVLERPGPVRRWYLWIEAYVRLHFGTPWMSHNRETTLSALFPGEYMPEKQYQQYAAKSRYNLRSSTERDGGYGNGKAAHFSPAAQWKPIIYAANHGNVTPHDSPLLDRTRVRNLHRRQGVQQAVYPCRHPQRSPLEARVRRLEDLGRWLGITVMIAIGCVLGYRLWILSGASVKFAALVSHIWELVLSTWVRLSDRTYKMASGLRDGWNA